ncbi:MAG: site-2 protease family protein [Pirellulaceae bacterium]
MKWSWKLGDIAGIGIFVNWSFLILPALIGYSAFVDGGPAAAAAAVTFILLIFGCVLLHELGHALMARRFGIPTRDITLLAIGGVARLERMPRKSSQELAVALAGPAVNVVIAGLLFAGMSLLGWSFALPQQGLNPFQGSMFESLMWANVGLVVFNMIPAFPMDGGRVLRALMSMFVSYERATATASYVGQGLAVVLAILGLFSNWMLVAVAMVVFFAARAELLAVRQAARFHGWSVRDVMVRQFHTVDALSSLESVAQTALFTGQKSFPVVEGNRLVGMLDQQRLLAALSAGHGDWTVANLMRRDFPMVDEQDQLDQTYQRMQTAGLTGLPVFAAGRLVGLLPIERLRQWLSFLAANANVMPKADTIDISWKDASHA